MAEANLRDVLMEIRARHGKLTPAIVLDEAKDPTHPLHHRFEWDDTVAAEKYRISQAQGLLRVKYREETANGVVDLRAFWVTRPTSDDPETAPDSEYTPVEEIMMDPIARQVMLNQMRREWKALQTRFGHMVEFAAMVEEAARGGREAG